MIATNRMIWTEFPVSILLQAGNKKRELKLIRFSLCLLVILFAHSKAF